MRQSTALLLAVVLVASGLAVAGSAMGHTEQDGPREAYEIKDQGVLTGYGGPAVNPLGGHVQNPATGENVFVPCGSQSVNTAGTGGEHHHVGSCVTYSVYVNGTSADGDDISRIKVDVDYENEDLNPVPGMLTPSADLDMYFYGPNGDIIDQDERADAGDIGIIEGDLAEGSYTALLVARHGVAPYETTITVTD